MKRKKILLLNDQVWLVFFSFVTFLWVLFFLFKVLPFLKNELIPLKKRDEIKTIYRVFVEDSNEDKKKQEDVFLSRKNQKASGALTNEQGFSSDSNSRLLNIQPDSSKSIYQNSKIKKNNDIFFDIYLIDENSVYQKKQGKKEQISKLEKSETSKNEIPFYYEEEKSFTFNYDHSKKLQLPTIAFEHYDYFVEMFDKIQEHWSPPGGRPYPVFGDEYHKSVYIPGRFTHKIFPSQSILVTFVLDNKGYVVKAEVYWSEGFHVLDESILDAIRRAYFFGVPPDELLEKNYLIVPVNFRIK